MFIRAEILQDNRDKDSGTLLEVTRDEPFSICVFPVVDDGLRNAASCPYESVSLEILSVKKDFHTRQPQSLPSDAIDEEFMTYPTAVVCFEDKNFKRFYQGGEESDAERSVLAKLVHQDEIFGYVARLKYTKQQTSGQATTVTTFWSRPIVFRVKKPKQWAPFDIVALEPCNDKFEKLVINFRNNSVEQKLTDL